MMDNLARIISHGFAIVVVILLGIGFIYRGELFPDLELPDFLMPESERMADAGGNLDNLQRGMAVTEGTSAGEPVEATPSAPPVEASATAPEAGVEAPEAAPPGVTVVNPAAQETAATETATGTVTEPRQAPLAEEVPPPAAEEPVPSQGASTVRGEASSAAATDAVPAPVPSDETPTEPQVEVPVSGAGTQPATVAPETSSEPGVSREPAPQTGSQIPAVGGGSYPGAPTDEGTAPTTGTAAPGSAPITSAEMQTSVSNAGQPPRSSSTQVKPYELLAAAREAFWLHNYDDAEKNYRALTELEPQDPDGYGELGNMYFSQGRWDEAAAAYYEAGTRLVSEGRLDSARELVNVIRGLNGQQADALDKLITSAAATGNH